MCFFTGLVLLVALEMWAPAMQKSHTAAGHLKAHALVALLIAVPALVLFGGLESILVMLGKDPTLTDRTVIWELLFTLTPSVWVGTGFQNFWLGSRLEAIWSEHVFRPGQAHNGYIEIYLNLGLIGAILVATVLASGYRTVMTGYHRSPVSGLMLAYFVVGIVYNFTEAQLFRMLTPVWFALLLAITRVPELHSPMTSPAPGRHLTARTAGLGGPDKTRGYAAAVPDRHA
jgi:O-antigen ligase